jgi:thiol:disulfide interchange protein
MTALSTSQAVFKERLLPKIPGLLPFVLLIPAIWLVMLPFSSSATALTVALVTFLVATTLRLIATKSTIVRDGKVELGANVISIDAIESIELLDKYAIRSALGPESDARALLFFASSANFALKVMLKENQAYPYVLISTNKPDQLKLSLGF